MKTTTRTLIAATLASLALASAFSAPAEARAGRSSGWGGSTYRSMGDRGVRTWDRSGYQGITQTRRSQAQPRIGGQTTPNPARPSWFQRHPFLAGLAGAVAGSALFSALSHAFGGWGLGGGGGGGLLTLLLLGGLVLLGLRMWQARRAPGYATPMGGWDRPEPPASAFGWGGGAIDAPRQTLDQGLAAIALRGDFQRERAEDELTGVFFRVQEAWSAHDVRTIRDLATPEMGDYFEADLTTMAQKGERNVIRNIVMRGFEVVEAWTEEGREFITARLHARLLDYVERHGKVVEGSDTEPTEFHEVWTFVREGGERAWRLSAINQV